MRPIKIASFPVAFAFALVPLGASGTNGAPRLASGAASSPASRPAEIYQAWPFDANEAVRRRDETAKATGLSRELILDLGKGVTMKLVLIPAGRFMMGSPDSEKGREEDEGPQHEVTISKPFHMGACEVTQEQWKQVMGTEPWNGQEFARNGGSNPASFINWNGATEFCRKLSQKTGKAVGLPSEAQWEYACRAGTQARFCCGEDKDYALLGDYAWSSRNAWAVGERYPHAAGQKKPNAWGLYDMHGNVFEWCSDWYAKSYANADKQDPQGPASGTSRVLRGGSFNRPEGDCRCGNRHCYEPGNGWKNTGLRVVTAAGPAD